MNLFRYICLILIISTSFSYGSEKSERVYGVIVPQMVETLIPLGREVAKNLEEYRKTTKDLFSTIEINKEAMSILADTPERLKQFERLKNDYKALETELKENDENPYFYESDRQVYSVLVDNIIRGGWLRYSYIYKLQKIQQALFAVLFLGNAASIDEHFEVEEKREQEMYRKHLGRR
ncbi:MAG TPA: hypothetical protein DD412_06890 [Holosporales bacterium]|nr:hypothetical protein [Holosporales bacterium]